MGNAKLRARKPLRSYDQVTYTVDGPKGPVYVRAFQESQHRWTYYFLTRRGSLLRIPPGEMQDAAARRLADMIDEENRQWREHEELLALLKDGVRWWSKKGHGRLIVTKEKRASFTGCRPFVWRWIPYFGGRVWWVKRAPKAKGAPAAEPSSEGRAA